MKVRNTQKKGFTLIELIVAVGVFLVVMLIASGALISIIESNKKAQSFKAVMNNLNFAFEGMTRTIRVGKGYVVSPNPGSSISFTNSQGVATGYRLSNNQVERSLNGAAFVSVTSPEVVVDTLEFTLDGTDPGDNEQPSVSIVLQGHTGKKVRIQTNFNLQTFVSQRLLDR